MYRNLCTWSRDKEVTEIENEIKKVDNRTTERYRK